MRYLSFRRLFTLGCIFGPLTFAQAQVRITEIMYHPSSENPAEEFVEVQNVAGTNVNLAGWRFTKGISFSFTNAIVLPAGGRVVVVANTNAFAIKYPSVTNYLGNWAGTLNNSDETIRIEDALGNTVDEVAYADEGDYAVRVRGVQDYNHRGWDWQADHDGGGKSLERINPMLTGKCGQNWAASVPTNGTPGAINSTSSANIAPLIRDVAHYPLVPRSTDPVTITAQLTDEQTIGLSATLFWRNASTTTPGAFAATPMFDDGAHGDSLAGDGLFGVVLPATTNGTVIEFYIAATDAQALSRTWPAPAIETNGNPYQVCNALYQVDDSETDSTQPNYRLIMTKAEYDELYSIPNEGDPVNRSHAAFNGTFVTYDGTSTELRYLCSFRNRGEGSRSAQPPNYRVNIPSDRRWKGVVALNLNSQYTHCQVVGAAVAAKAGLVTEQHRHVHLRVNGNDRAAAGLKQFGAYVHQEVQDSDFAANHFPTDSGGNVYRAGHPSWDADLSYQGTNWQAYTNRGYAKTSNNSENDWSDLIHLTDVLNNTPDGNYWTELQQVANVSEWVRYFAVFTLTGSQETSLGTGAGDDFSLYRGLADPRFQLTGHDWDTILNQGDHSGDPNQTLFGAANGIPAIGTPGVAAAARFLKHPEVAPRYYAELLYQLSNTFTPAEMSHTLDEKLAGWVPANYITIMKTFATNRYAGALAQIPVAQTVDGSSPAGILTGGVWRYTTANVKFFGSAHAARTRIVTINGQPAAWTAWTAHWTNTVTLRPGLNNLLVQSFDENGVEVGSTNRLVWFDNGAAQTVGGTIGSDTTWTASAGPYNLTSSLNIANGATLTIDPGATVFLASGVNLTVANGGRLLAEGNATNRIYFMGTPGSGVNWGGLIINGAVGSPETRIAHAHFEGNTSTCIEVAAGTVFLDHLTFGTTTHQYLSLDGASFIIQDCNFPTATAAFELVHGTGGIKTSGHGVFVRNFFGAANSYNDVVDFTGGNRPAPIVHFIDNVFIGSGDDLLDLDGTDAWVEGNIFLHAHKNGAPDTSSAVSGGDDSGNTSEITIVGNLIYDCDHAALAKLGNFYTLLNNTIVHQSHQGGLDTEGAVVCVADAGIAEGAGMYLEGNIISDAEALVRGRTNAIVTLTNNLIYQLAGSSWSGPGGNNATNAPLFQYAPQLADTTNFDSWAAAQVMKDWFSLRSGSPAIGAGPNARDQGGVVPLGASIAGEPVATTAATSATLTVGTVRTGGGIPAAGFPNGSGYTHYKWRLNGGNWSAETSITTPIALTSLTSGSYVVEVSGKRDSGLYQDATEFANSALVTTSRTWTVNTTLPGGLRLNEILARNRFTLVTNGESPDLFELFNSSGATIDLSGKGVTDDPLSTAKFTFPPGTTLAAGQFMVLFSDSSGNPARNLGFGLNSNGGEVLLFDSVANGGALLDHVSFGPQLVDLSIGRQVDGTWGLCQPTFGSANIAKPAANGETLRINEWLASGAPTAPDDFVELYNPDPVPTAMGGLYLSDAPDGSPTRNLIAPLSYIAAGGYFAFKADGNTNSGPEHLNFKLSPSAGSLGLFAADRSMIDRVVYGPQTSGVSQGRSPDGSAELAFFPTPTPGAGNPGALPIYITNITFSLMAYTNVWRFNQSNNLDGINWTATNYNDNAWQSGPGLLAFENNTALVPLIKTTLLDPRTPPPGLSAGHAYYFRTPLVVTNDLTGFTVNARMRLDDCGVIYINGTEFSRPRMAPGTITNLSFGGGAPGAGTEADADEVFTIPAALLHTGTNILAVEVHQINNASSDIVWGMALDAVRYFTNVTSVVLNEVLADNGSFTNNDGTITDWVELYNPSAIAVNLAGYSLSDDPTTPGRWVFPAGVSLAPGGFVLVRCDSTTPASTTNGPVLNTGFGLNSAGDEMCLFTPGGALFDSVVFGPQAADFSLGHAPEGSLNWELTLPTPGSANISATLGNVNNVRINEWAATVANGPDWFELYNPNPQPVALGGLYLTDLLSNRTKHPIAPLSFLGVNTNGWCKFIADSNTAQGANHVNFSLNGTVGEALGLFPPGTAPAIDSVTFGPQTNDVSEGRFPDGAANRVFFTKPSPGDANWLYLTNIVINEVLSHTDPPLEDAVELRNLSSSPVDVSGWFISDDINNLRKFRIPNDTVIPADGYKVFYEYELNPLPGFATSFSFSSADGDDVWLTAADELGTATGFRDYAKFGPQFNGVSFGRVATSVGFDFAAMSGLTFGTPVTAQSPTNQITLFRTGNGAANAYPRVGPIVITEIMYHPTPVGTNENPNEEFIELHNLSGVTFSTTPHPTNGWLARRSELPVQHQPQHPGGWLSVPRWLIRSTRTAPP
ncbi:MAG: lamin tail domain-containing protein [Verrucomicrobiota bacterium]